MIIILKYHLHTRHRHRITIKLPSVKWQNLCLGFPNIISEFDIMHRCNLNHPRHHNHHHNHHHHHHHIHSRHHQPQQSHDDDDDSENKSGLTGMGRLAPPFQVGIMAIGRLVAIIITIIIVIIIISL